MAVMLLIRINGNNSNLKKRERAEPETLAELTLKKTYRNNLNNVLQNLLNEFYTYAKSAFVTLTKYWTVSLLNLFRPI